VQTARGQADFLQRQPPGLAARRWDRQLNPPTRRGGQKGTDACTGEPIRADVLEAAVLAALILVCRDPDLIERAIAAKEADGVASIRRHEKEVAATIAEPSKTDPRSSATYTRSRRANVTEEMFGTRERAWRRNEDATRSRSAHSVEVKGLEPSAYGLQSRRSTS
jgi:hypothetical protein